MNFYLIGFCIYFIILTLIMLAVRKKAQTAEHAAGFMLGNRSINFWLTALSAHASDMSDWLFMAYPAVIFTGGMPQTWIAISLIVGAFLSWHYIAPRLRIETERYNAYTLSSYFEARLYDSSSIIRLTTACMSLLFLTIYIAAGLKGIGFLLESTFGIPYAFGILFAISFVALYTLIGGFVAVAWIDAFQATFLLSVLLIVPIVAYMHIPQGITHIIANATEKNIPLSMMPHSIQDIIQIIFIVFTWGLGYFSMPHILTKFMGIDNPNQMYKSKYIGMSWQVLVLTAATLVGLVGIAFFADGLVNKELIFVEMVKILFHPLLAGFMLCAILAAGLSTIDSQVLVLASVLTQDLYTNIFKKQTRHVSLVRFYRLSIIVICMISCLIALNKTSTIQDLVRYAWMGLTCTFGPVVIMCLYSSKITKYGALAGIIVGGTLSAVWEALLGQIIPIYDMTIPAALPGFLGGLLAIYLFSSYSTQS